MPIQIWLDKFFQRTNVRCKKTIYESRIKKVTSVRGLGMKRSEKFIRQVGVAVLCFVTRAPGDWYERLIHIKTLSYFCDCRQIQFQLYAKIYYQEQLQLLERFQSCVVVITMYIMISYPISVKSLNCKSALIIECRAFI